MVGRDTEPLSLHFAGSRCAGRALALIAAAGGNNQIPQAVPIDIGIHLVLAHRSTGQLQDRVPNVPATFCTLHARREEGE
jgi:hypothetical protein